MMLYAISFTTCLLSISAVSSLPAKSYANGGEVGNELMARLNSVLLKSVGGIPSSNLEIGPFENLVIRLLFANWTETDPWNFEDAEYIYSSPFVTGDHSTTDNVMTGFSAIRDALWLTITPPPGLRYRIDLDEILSVGGGYESNLSFLNNLIHFSGNGQFTFELEKAFGYFALEVSATETSTEITRLEVDAGFDRLEIHAENSELNCSPANWDEINQEIRILFDIYWPVARDVFIPLAQTIINEAIKDCNLGDLLQGDFTCITGEDTEPIPELLAQFTRDAEEIIRNRPFWKNACPEA